MKRLAFILVLIILVLPFSSCAKQSQENPEPDQIDSNSLSKNESLSDPYPYYDSNAITSQQVNASLYFLDDQNNRLALEVRQIEKFDENDLIVKIIKELVKGPKGEGLKPVIPPSTKINKVDRAENILTINLSAEFLDSDDLIIARAALVNTLTDIEQYKYIKIYIDGNELTSDGKDDGVVLGLLTRYPNNVSDIIAVETRENDNGEIRRVNRELYFQDHLGVYLLPEVRTITINNNDQAQAIVDEIIKGPANQREGLYPTLPKGIKLNKVEYLKDADDIQEGIALYFSKEFKTQFTGGSSQEITMLGSLVYSLTTLTNVWYVKIFYEDEVGNYVDESVGNITINQGLTANQFANLVGRRIKVFFGDKEGSRLVPEYRAMSRNNLGIARQIIKELTGDPVNSDGVRVIPDHINDDDIKVRMDDETAVVDLPAVFFNNGVGRANIIRALYAIVNSLTDPINTRNIKQVQFYMEGKVVEDLKDISLADPFVRNPALIKE